MRRFWICEWKSWMKGQSSQANGRHMAQYHLLRKTELRIAPVWLRNANLNDLATVVADTLGMEREAVFVTDLRAGSLTLDILQDNVDAAKIVGKRDELLRRLAALPGVRITEATAISSDGMLGWVAHDERLARRALRRTRLMAEQVRQKLQKRAIVLSTGAEVATGEIEDTNAPLIIERLEAEGYSVARGPTAGDDATLIAGVIRQAACDDGYALVITTGGVGAEDKDCTIEALLSLDPEAATPYICRYETGAGRHHKDGVRIGVGQLAEAIVVALPGPNDEVRSSLDILVNGLTSSLGKHALSEAIAENLRKKLLGRTRHRLDGKPDINSG